MTQLNYKEEKFDLTVPAYPFEMPPGANNYKEAFQLLPSGQLRLCSITL